MYNPYFGSVEGEREENCCLSSPTAVAGIHVHGLSQRRKLSGSMPVACTLYGHSIYCSACNSWKGMLW